MLPSNYKRSKIDCFRITNQSKSKRLPGGLHQSLKARFGYEVKSALRRGVDTLGRCNFLPKVGFSIQISCQPVWETSHLNISFDAHALVSRDRAGWDHLELCVDGD